MANISHESVEFSEAVRLLGHAADKGELETVQHLISQYPSILDARGGILRSTALHFAAASGHLEVARFLIDSGADVNAREYASGTLPIHWASLRGHFEIVKLLAENNCALDLADDWFGMMPVGWACALPANARTPIADYLVTRGASYDIFSLISLQRDTELRMLLTASPEALSSRIGRIGERYNALHWAVEKENRAALQALVEAGADVDEKSVWGVSPLALAVQQGKTELKHCLESSDAAKDLSTLIALGAYRDAAAALQGRQELVNRGGACELLIHWLTQQADVHGLKVILDAGADTSAQSATIIDELICSAMALHRAADMGHIEIVRMLLEHNADPNYRCGQVGEMPYWDVTPLHVAAWRGHVEVGKILIEHGSDIAARDNHGIGTPGDWARAWWDDDMAVHFESP